MCNTGQPCTVRTPEKQCADKNGNESRDGSVPVSSIGPSPSLTGMVSGAFKKRTHFCYFTTALSPIVFAGLLRPIFTTSALMDNIRAWQFRLVNNITKLNPTSNSIKFDTSVDRISLIIVLQGDFTPTLSDWSHVNDIIKTQFGSSSSIYL